jgi:uncharacterized protein (TIGR02466 family)
MALNDYPKAAAAFRRELALDPDHAGAANNLMPALLGAGRYDEAFAVADRALARRPWHVPALAFKSVALAELGRRDELAELVNLEALITIDDLAPGGALRNLATALREEKSLAFAPQSHATREGWHSEDLSGASAAAIQALNASIVARIDARIAALRGGDHPFLRACPTSYRLHAWAVVMGRGGHQIPHIHSRAWLSGVYYVDLPDDVREDDPTHAGWLTFGRAEEQWHRPETWTPVRQICPRPGMLVTFPSFFWHGTYPVATPRRRISYAFDVIPT